MIYRVQMSLLAALMPTMCIIITAGPFIGGCDIFDTLTVNIGHRYIPNIPLGQQPILRTLTRTSSFAMGAIGLSIYYPQLVPFLPYALKMTGIAISTFIGVGTAIMRAGAIRTMIALVCVFKFKNPAAAITITVKPEVQTGQAYVRVRDLLIASCTRCYVLPMCAGVAIMALAGMACKQTKVG